MSLLPLTFLFLFCVILFIIHYCTLSRTYLALPIYSALASALPFISSSSCQHFIYVLYLTSSSFSSTYPLSVGG